jgi:hypothetical protein
MQGAEGAEGDGEKLVGGERITAKSQQRKAVHELDKAQEN